MNRIQDLLDDEPELGSPRPILSAPTISSGNNENPHSLFIPQHYESNYAYPLIVWLHGPNDDERQVNRILPLISPQNYAGVGPRGTALCAEAGYRWLQSDEQIAAAEERVLRSIRIARRWLNIEPRRIYVGGYDCGATMAFRLALAHPDRFAGVLAIGGGLPRTFRPLARWNELRGMQVFLAAGRTSERYSESDVCHDLRLFHATSMQVNLRLYPCGDEVTTEMLADMNRWIMAEMNAGESVPSDEHSHRR